MQIDRRRTDRLVWGRIDGGGSIGCSFARNRQADRPKITRRSRYRSVPWVERGDRGTLDEVQGRDCFAIDERKFLLLERESWKDKRKIKPFLVLGKNLLAWNNARGTILREVISWSSWERQALLLTLITECGYRASSIATRGKGLHTNLTIMTIDSFISRISIRSSIFKYE